MESKEIYPRVELADSTVLNADAGYANGDLWVWMKDDSKGNKDFLKAVKLFATPEKTSVIRYFVTENLKQEWEGMTDLITVTVVDGRINIRLRKAVE